ncbi:MAG: EamA family transporter [Rhodobacterales bacterium]|nr:MAG: EamA family transporter [Rhodobacterales bacterium]
MEPRAMGMGLIFALMWSSAFTSGRVIVQYAPPLSALSLRFFISGLVGVLIARALGQSWHLSKSQWRSLAIFGVCQNGLYLGLLFVAMQWVEASMAAIIASTMPLLVAFAGWLLFRERIAPLGIAGLVAGMVGVAIIMGARLSGGANLVGVALCVVAVLSLTIATLVIRGTQSHGNALMIVGLQMLVGSASLLPAALLFDDGAVTWSWQLFVAFAYTTLVPGLAATLVWFLLVNRIGTVRAAVFHFLTPFLGVTIAAILLGEALGPLDLLGVAVIAGGIFAVQVSKQSS